MVKNSINSTVDLLCPHYLAAVVVEPVSVIRSGIDW